jgi:hypothetical protein
MNDTEVQLVLYAQKCMVGYIRPLRAAWWSRTRDAVKHWGQKTIIVVAVDHQ